MRRVEGCLFSKLSTTVPAQSTKMNVFVSLPTNPILLPLPLPLSLGLAQPPQVLLPLPPRSLNRQMAAVVAAVVAEMVAVVAVVVEEPPFES
jgi:hypothetical protein